MPDVFVGRLAESMLMPTDPADMRTVFDLLEAEWAITHAAAAALPEATRHQQVNGEWSYVETLRHLVFAIDKWFTAPVLGEPFSPIGMSNRGSVDFPWPNIDLSLAVTSDEALALFTDRMNSVRRFLETVDAADLDTPMDVLENGPHALNECIYTVLEEGFWHLRYIRRDLALLDASA
jgi:hypothetical protein